MILQELIQWGINELGNQKEHAQKEHTQEVFWLLCALLKVDKSHLIAWPEKELSQDQVMLFESMIEKRKQGLPLAYLLGHQEFWSMTFKVTPDTLIPRPETEVLVEALLNLLPRKPQKILELGTGSGAIACALASERPDWIIHAVDFDPNTLKVAQQNINTHQCHQIHAYQSNWFESVKPEKFNAIVSNPPYVAEHSPYLECGTRYEPQKALISGEDGLKDLKQIIQEAKAFLVPLGVLCLEHGFDQRSSVHQYLIENGYHSICHIKDFNGKDRVTYAYAD